MSHSSPRYPQLLFIFIFLGFGLSGAAALIYEVAWTRSLSTIMGSSTYAVSTMLAAFMAGLSLGGWLGSFLAPRLKKLDVAFAFCELGIGVTGLLTVPIILAATPLYIKSFYTFHLSFNTFSVVQFMIIFTIMAIPTTLMGLTFPIVIKLFSSRRQSADIGKDAGTLYGINTLGAIAGSTAAGFLLIPTIGIKGATLTAAGINIFTAATILVLSREKQKATIVITLLLCSLPFAAMMNQPAFPFFSYYNAFRYNNYALAENARQRIMTSPDSKILYQHEGVNGTVSLIQYRLHDDGPYQLGLYNNGKLEAGDTTGFALLGFLPYYLHNPHHPEESVLNIGLGSGHTLARIADLPVGKIDSVELSQGIIEVNRRFLRPDLFNNPRIHHTQADGKNFLLLTENSYDFIIASPSWAIEAASGGMLTDEFFQLVQNRLHDSGTFALWVDYFMMDFDDLEILARTFHKHFDHSLAWLIEGDMIIMVGSNSAFKDTPEKIRQAINTYQPELAGKFQLMMNEEMVDNLPRGPLNTDDRPVIEFHNARNFITWKHDN